MIANLTKENPHSDKGRTTGDPVFIEANHRREGRQGSVCGGLRRRDQGKAKGGPGFSQVRARFRGRSRAYHPAPSTRMFMSDWNSGRDLRAWMSGSALTFSASFGLASMASRKRTTARER